MTPNSDRKGRQGYIPERWPSHISFLVHRRWRRVTKMLIKMGSFSIDGAILILALGHSCLTNLK